MVSPFRQSSNFVLSVGSAYAITAEEVEKKYPSAMGAIAGVVPPLKPGERLMKFLLVNDNLDGDTEVPIMVAPNAYVIPRERFSFMPSFDPEWLSKLKEDTRF